MELIYIGPSTPTGFEWFVDCVSQGPIKYTLMDREELTVRIVGDFTPYDIERLHLLAQATMMPNNATDHSLEVTTDGGGSLAFSCWDI